MHSLDVQGITLMLLIFRDNSCETINSVCTYTVYAYDISEALISGKKSTSVFVCVSVASVCVYECANTKEREKMLIKGYAFLHT